MREILTLLWPCQLEKLKYKYVLVVMSSLYPLSVSCSKTVDNYLPPSPSSQLAASSSQPVWSVSVESDRGEERRGQRILIFSYNTASVV